MAAEPAEKAKDAPKAKKGRSKFIVILLLVMLLGGGGVGGYWFFVMKPAAEAAAAAQAGGEQNAPAESQKHAKSGGAALKFDPFVVNLADEGGARYLRLGLSLVIDGDEAEAKELEESKVQLLRIRSAVLDLLSQQLADHVVTADGKKALREAIEHKCNEILAPVEVTDVLFTEFVVQF